MSLLNPGGSRDAAGYRLFDWRQIRTACKRALKGRDHARIAFGSIAKGNRWGGPHEHKREIARRARQSARRGSGVGGFEV